MASASVLQASAPLYNQIPGRMVGFSQHIGGLRRDVLYHLSCGRLTQRRYQKGGRPLQVSLDGLLVQRFLASIGRALFICIASISVLLRPYS
ncbi:hypothetical protein INP77_06240 [Methylophilus sp. 13]|uniref:hypothetical protein n=1 Tax=Methylophilus sp. 13 TaxID=2781018 RepID=UPI00188E3A56|nr:hypothetical protein [Methylophilus sp. 13]MBF5039088.1 hypothetical protein [Methylophilus sp. 13]